MKMSQVKEIVAQNEAVATITIYQPNDQPYTGSDGNPSTISFKGSESKAYRAKQQELADRQIAEGKRTLTLEENRALQAELAASVVTGWSGWEAEDGSPLPATADNVLGLLGAEHILTQVQICIARHARFFGASSPS